MIFANLFSETMESVLRPLDFLPTPNGAIHRVPVPGDKSGVKNGWHVQFLDCIAGGVFGSWGGSHTRSSRKPVDHVAAQLVAQRIKQARRRREVKLHQRQQAAAESANRLWGAAQPAADDHPDLTRKRVMADSLRQHGDVLLMPLRLANLLATVTSSQFGAPSLEHVVGLPPTLALVSLYWIWEVSQ